MYESEKRTLCTLTISERRSAIPEVEKQILCGRFLITSRAHTIHFEFHEIHEILDQTGKHPEPLNPRRTQQHATVSS